MTHSPTPEQQACIDAYLSSSENLQIRALAGAAKTTTLTMLASADQSRSVLAIAFNKHIANELAERMPSNTVCKTMNAIGHRMLGDFLSRRIQIDGDKRRKLLRSYIDAQPEAVKTALYETYQDLSSAIAHGANAGWIPEGKHPHATHLYDSDEEFYAELDFEPSAEELACIRAVTINALDAALQGQCDFNDQIIVPALWPCTFMPFNVTLIDEAQDLSPLQHRLLTKIVGRKGRLIAVGDPCQAIYAFRGADEKSMSSLGEMFQMQTLLLSTSFRLPRSIAEHVRWRAPHIQSPEWAIEGQIHYPETWNCSIIPDHAAVICRNNAPLLRMAFRLLEEGRKPKLWGNDVLAGLVRDMKKLSKDQRLPSEDALLLVDEWERAALQRYKKNKTIPDKAECMRLFLHKRKTLGLAIAEVETIARLEGTIALCTGHKSKGFEWDHVFFLDRHLIRDDKPEAGQERNLRYVISTRAKRSLTYIRSEDYLREDS